jgi:hypothetical protein
MQQEGVFYESCLEVICTSGNIPAKKLQNVKWCLIYQENSLVRAVSHFGGTFSNLGRDID